MQKINNLNLQYSTRDFDIFLGKTTDVKFLYAVLKSKSRDLQAQFLWLNSTPNSYY